MVKIIAVIAVLLAGCAAQSALPEYMTPGRYPNYRAMFQGEMFRWSQDRDFAACSGLFIAANVAPADLARLDQYARGEIPLSASNMGRVDDDLTKRIVKGNPRETLRPYCPDKVDGFRLPSG